MLSYTVQIVAACTHFFFFLFPNCQMLRIESSFVIGQMNAALLFPFPPMYEMMHAGCVANRDIEEHLSRSVSCGDDGVTL